MDYLFYESKNQGFLFLFLLKLTKVQVSDMVHQKRVI